MKKFFPWTSFILITLMIATFLFTYPQLNTYKKVLGFVPKHPKIYTIITYTLIHISPLHLLGNLVFLLIASLAIEEELGEIPFLSIYIASGSIAATFDSLGRVITGVSLSVPFVGSSGAIFGLLMIASLIKPTKKIPTLLLLLSFLPFVEILYKLPGIYEYKVFLSVMIFVATIFTTCVIILPKGVPIPVAMLIFLISWVLTLTLNLSPSVSHIGHLGGVVGGLFALPLFRKK